MNQPSAAKRVPDNSAIITATRIEKALWLCTGGAEPHYVHRDQHGFSCDCGQFIWRGGLSCKHIRAVQRLPTSLRDTG